MFSREKFAAEDELMRRKKQFERRKRKERIYNVEKNGRGVFFFVCSCSVRSRLDEEKKGRNDKERISNDERMAGRVLSSPPICETTR